MSATVAEQPKSAIEREREKTLSTARIMLTRDIRRPEGRLRAISPLADPPPPFQATKVTAEPPHPAAEGSRAEGSKEAPFASTTPDGKPLREAGATQILKILAAAQRDRRQAEAAAKAAEEAKRPLPPWHGRHDQEPTIIRQPARSANADAVAIAVRMAEELANLVNRIVAWMKNPPPFATSPESSETPERQPSAGAEMGVNP
jgi:hypothetical protein